MSAFVKYAMILASGLAIGSHVPGLVNLEDVGRRARLDELSNVINKALAPTKPDAASDLIGPAAAARVDEDLDYRIAQGIGSLDGWRTFLATHGSGAHAQSAKAEIDKLLFAVNAAAPAEVSEDASSDVKAGREVTHPDTPSPGTEVAVFTRDEIYVPHGESLDRSRFRPQLASLVDGSDSAAPAPVATPLKPAVKIGPNRGSKPRATEPPRRMTLSSDRPEPRPHAHRCTFGSACYWRSKTLPPILLALFGERPKHSRAFARKFADARPSGK
jgi:hypothetical protein